MNVAQPHVMQRLELGLNLWNILQHWDRVFHSRFQKIRNRMTFILHLQSLTVIAPPATYIASDIHVRQEVHFYALQSVALTRLAAAAFHVEAESPGLIAAL